MAIPTYWKKHLQQKIDTIRALQRKIGEDAITFAMITDIHWGNSAQRSGELLTEVMKACDIPYFFNGGDTFTGFPFCTKSHIFEDMQAYYKAFSAIEERCLMVMGNHDAAFSTRITSLDTCYDENLTKAEIYEHYFAFLRKYPHRVFGDDAYYYVDDERKQVRYIVLNTHDVPSDEKDENGLAVYNSFRLFCIRQPQLEWFAHVALDVPSPEWSVVLCSHENLTAKPKHQTHNNALLTGIIRAFQRHTSFALKTQFEDEPFCNAEISVDFTGRGGNFIGWLAGHIHRDDMVKQDGIVAVSTCNDATRSGEGERFFHIGGTDSEHSFDVFTVDKKNRKVYITRVGYGEDREFVYE